MRNKTFLSPFSWLQITYFFKDDSDGMIWLHFTVYIFSQAMIPIQFYCMKKSSLDSQLNISLPHFCGLSLKIMTSMTLIYCQWVSLIRKKMSFCSVSKNGTKINYIEEWKRKRLNHSRLMLLWCKRTHNAWVISTEWQIQQHFTGLV